MRRNTLNNSITAATLSLALAAAAGAQELVKSDEHRLQQDSQAFFMMAPSYGKLTFTATGAASDLVVIRLADGSVFATATMEQLVKGITGDNKVPEGKEEEGVKPEGEDVSGKDVSGKDASGTTEISDTSTQEIPDVIDGEATEETDSSASGNEAKLLEALKPIGDWSAIEVKPSLGTNNPDNNVAWKSLAAPVDLLRADFTLASIPWAFHGGSITIYRGTQELDRDMILLY
ncbi:MAG: hypothetical protein ACKOYN_09240 [Planctomycetota bacterium]